jgi:dihydrofolate reductase
MPRVRLFCATSLDGFLAGPDDDLSWLPGATTDSDPSASDGGFAAFLDDVGAILMGRRSWDVVAGFGGPLPYGDRPLLVATHRPLIAPSPEVRPVCGPIDALIAEARAAAGRRDVYLDGGQLIRQAIDAELVDDATITVVPVILGRGVPLFAGVAARRRVAWLPSAPRDDGFVQWRVSFRG